MKSKTFFKVACFCMALSTCLAAARPVATSYQQVDLLTALGQGMVEAWANPLLNGMGFRQPAVELTVINHSGTPLELIVPLAARLNSSEPTYSDLVVAEEAVVQVEGETRVNLSVFRLRYELKSPSGMDASNRYDVDGELNKDLRVLLEQIVEKDQIKNYSAQLAVWSWMERMAPDGFATLLDSPPTANEVEEAIRLLSDSGWVLPAQEPTPRVATNTPLSVDAPAPAAPIALGAEEEQTKGRRPLPSYGLLCLVGGMLAVFGALLLVAVVLTAREKRAVEVESSVPVVALPAHPAPLVKPIAPTHEAVQTKGPAVPLPHTSLPPAEKVSVVSTPSKTQVVIPADTPPQLVSAVRTYQLRGTTGPLAGKIIIIAGPTLLSRGDAQVVTLPWPSLSTPHLALDLYEQPYRIKDLNSQTGIQVEGKRLGREFYELFVDAPIQLADDLVLRVGVGGEVRVEEGNETVTSQGTYTTMVVVSADELVVAVTGEDDKKISQPHAVMNIRFGTLTIKDLNSSNGVWVNQQRLTSVTDLKAGDQLRLGETDFVVEAG